MNWYKPSEITEEPIPIIQFSPITFFWCIEVPLPIVEYLPIFTLPETFTLTCIVTNSSNIASCAIMELKFTIQCFEIFVSIDTTTPEQIIHPSSILLL